MIHLLQMIKLKLRSNIWAIKLFPLVDFSELTDTFVLVLTIKVHFDQFNRKEDFLFNVILLKLMCHVLRIFRFLNWKTRSKHCRRSSFSAVRSEGTVKHLFSIFYSMSTTEIDIVPFNLLLKFICLVSKKVLNLASSNLQKPWFSINKICATL